MGYDYVKRISLLKRQTDEEKAGRLGFLRTFFRAFLALLVLTYIFRGILPASDPEAPSKVLSNGEPDPDEVWRANVKRDFEERLHWLETSVFSVSPGAADMYESFGKSVVSIARYRHSKQESAVAQFFDLTSYLVSISQGFVSMWLRLGFVLLGFWPLWILSFIVGYFGLRSRFRKKATPDLLGICDRGVTPFYSGIYGPLRSNNSFSGTDYACPSLACPEMVSAKVASAHKLVALLKRFNAFNQTNFQLVRIILQYADFPCMVEDEQGLDDEGDMPTDLADRVSQTAFFTNAGGTIEQSSLIGLEAALSAHAAIIRLIAQEGNDEKGAQRKAAQRNSDYLGHINTISKLVDGLSPTGKMLAFTLTPNRAWALGHLPASVVATTYLAIEAGKCLVYKRQGNGFTRISRYPHLQARAILQSIVDYLHEHTGDMRLIIRQAIICSRRHGDFARAFLPERLPVESRALRDWLEILYAEPKRREISAYLVELDSHIEEISFNFRMNYTRRLKTWFDNVMGSHEKAPLEFKGDSQDNKFWKGVVFKSVVLVPLLEVIQTALRGIDDARLKRVLQLVKLTRRYQTNMSISARLPGFKRQAVEAQTSAIELLSSTAGNSDLVDRWLIVRRMLTKYNWLSTRVGDDAVPAEGVVQGIVTHLNDATSQPEVSGFDALVPLRQRRYEEILGRQWEQTYYYDSPHPTNIKIHIDREKYVEGLRVEKIAVARGTSVVQGTIKPPSVASA